MRPRRLALTLIALLSMPASAARADAASDAVLDWNAIMVTTVSWPEPVRPGAARRDHQLAVFEAVNAIAGEYEPYLGTIAAPPGASAEAAAVAAAHARARATTSRRRATTLDAALGTHRSPRSPTASPKDDGVAVGRRPRRADRRCAPPTARARRSSTAGVVRPGRLAADARAARRPAASCFHWQNVTPVRIESNDQFHSAPPPALTSPQYARDYDEVRRSARSTAPSDPPDRADVARLLRRRSCAAGVWNRVARQLATAEPLSLVGERARPRAPQHGDQRRARDRRWRRSTTTSSGGRRRPFAPALPTATPDRRGTGFAAVHPTPCFPSYPSAHASASYAGRCDPRQRLGRRWPPRRSATGHAERRAPLHEPEADHRRHRRRPRLRRHPLPLRPGGRRQAGTQVGQYVFAHYLQALEP